MTGLSSRLTYFFKYIVPVLMIIADVFLIYIISRTDLELMYVLMFSFLLVFFSSIQIIEFLKLSIVHITIDEKLVVDNNGKTSLYDQRNILSLKSIGGVLVRLEFIDSSNNVQTIIYIKRLSLIFSRLINLDTEFSDELEDSYKKGRQENSV
jgi:hypothetical protein